MRYNRHFKEVVYAATLHKQVLGFYAIYGECIFPSLSMDESVSNLRVVGWYFPFFYILKETSVSKLI